MNKNKNSWAVKLANELKQRDNKEQVSSCIGTVINLNPLTVGIYGGEFVLTLNDNLFLTETFSKRINLDKEKDLSEFVVNKLNDINTNLSDANAKFDLIDNLVNIADSLTMIHSFTGITCNAESAVSLLKQAINSNKDGSIYLKSAIDNAKQSVNKINTELLNLKCDLKVKDKVLIIPSVEQDIFYLIDKI